jgi:putative tryptophan/tyrosine transport system substrate-binding protein
VLVNVRGRGSASRRAEGGRHGLRARLGTRTTGIYSQQRHGNRNGILVASRRIGTLLVSEDTYFDGECDRLVSLAARYSVPTVYQLREFATIGGLMSYGASIRDAYQQAGAYVAKILNGDKPADLPVLLPTRLQLVINLKTAAALGLTVPTPLLASADEIIE